MTSSTGTLNELSLPIDWRVARIGRLCRSGMGQTILKEMLEEPGTDGAVPVYSASEKDTEFGWLSNPQVRLKAGDLVVGARGSIGHTRKIGRDATCTQTTIWLKVDHPEVSADYLYWCLLADRERLFPFDKTAIPMLTVEQVRSGSVPFPPLPNQTAIAAFLERETGKIDALVEEQRRLIALLKEKRQAVISHAVTKGLDGSAKMKPSGVEWLGDVPEHWDVRPLKYAAEFVSGGTPSKANPDYWDGDVPWVSAKDLKADVLKDSQDHITEYAVSTGAASLVPGGSVVVLVRGMMLARAFPVAQVAVPMAINQDLKAIVRSNLQLGYLAWVFRGLERESLARTDEAGHGTKTIRMEAWTSMTIPAPPREEQEAIQRHLDITTKALDGLAASAHAAIDLLQERRSTLIFAAVTGKIDVREATTNQEDAA